MPSLTVLDTTLKFDKHFKTYSGNCMTEAGLVPVSIYSEEGNLADLVLIAERTLRGWSRQLKKVLPEVKKMLIEQEFLPATKAKALKVSDMSVTGLQVRDDGFGSFLDIGIDLEKWYTESDDERQARYLENCADGTADIEVYTF